MLTAADAALVAADPAIAGLRLALDDSALVDTLAAHNIAASGARVRRVRYKPGVSVQAAVEAPRSSERWWLFAAYAGTAAAKLAKDVATGGVVADLGDRWLWCPARRDRALRKAWRALEGWTPSVGEIVTYNPRRRAVLRVDRGTESYAVKLYAHASDMPSPRLADRLAKHGAPIAPTVAGAPRRLAITPWLTGRHPEPGTADDALVAEAVCTLHRAAHRRDRTAVTGMEWRAHLVRRCVVALRTAARLNPRVARAAADLARRLPAALAGDLGPTGVAHGDLSTDQVLLTGAGVRLLDLDASGVAPVAWDEASWWAAQMGSGHPPAPLPGLPVVAALRSAALALRCVEPFARRRTDWAELGDAMITRALAEVRRSPRSLAAMS